LHGVPVYVYSLYLPRRDGQDELTWVAGFIGYGLAGLPTVNIPTGPGVDVTSYVDDF